MSEWSWLARTELLVGSEKVEKLNRAKVMVVGLGGVGSFAAEFLGRAGIGCMAIIDGDTVDRSNKNRQLPALDSTVGQGKAEVMAARLRDISPEMELLVIPHFQEPDHIARLLQQEKYDFVLDCIDSLQPKIQLITTCLQTGQPLISSMGAGGRYNPEFVRIAPLGETHHCPFAQQVRKSVRRQGLRTDFPVVFSDEATLPDSMEKTDGTRYKKSYYGTISYMPALFGLYMASYVIRKTMGVG